MHIAHVSRPDLAYSVMRFYMACPNVPIFEALHLTLLPGDYGNGLATFADADFARCLCTRHSVSTNFHLLNGVIISWSCKKQPVTALHSSGAELTSLHRAGFKSSLLQSFLTSIGNPLIAPAVIFEDNQGTIKLIRTQRLTNTVCHHDVKLAWLNENFL
jgi:hypothetical protein